MKTIRMFGILTIFLLLVAISSASAYVTISTDKRTYSQAEPVVFTIKNLGPDTIDWRVQDMIVLDATGGIIYQFVCSTDICLDDWLVVEPGTSVKWTWDQTDSEGNHVPNGRYQGYFNGYKSNTFRIKGNSQDSTITVRGHIESGVEGCTVLIADSGGSYELRYDGCLPPIGSYVLVTGTIMNDTVSVCMQGPILKVQRIFVIG